MRFTTSLVVAGALPGLGLAAGPNAPDAVRQLTNSMKQLQESMSAWAGDVLSTGDMLCRAYDVSTASDRALAALQASKSSDLESNASYQASTKELGSVGMSFIGEALKSRRKMNEIINKGVRNQVIAEILESQKDRIAMTMTDAVALAHVRGRPRGKPEREVYEDWHATMVEGIDFVLKYYIKKPSAASNPSRRQGGVQGKVRQRKTRASANAGAPSGKLAIVQALSNAVNSLYPKKDLGPIFTADKVKVRKPQEVKPAASSVNLAPFCKAQPKLSQLFTGKNPIRFGDVTRQIQQICRENGLQDQTVEFEVVRQFMLPFFPPKQVDALERQVNGRKLGDFISGAVDAVARFGVQDQQITGDRVNQLIKTVISNMQVQEMRQPEADNSRQKKATPASKQELGLLTRYAKLAAAAYQPKCNRVPENFQIVGPISDGATGTDGFIGVSKQAKEIIVAFRGTSDTRDVETDFGFAQTEFTLGGCPQCKVHTGFLTSWNAVSKQVKDTVANLRRQNPGYKVVVTGHSLGGALASIAAVSLSKDNIPVTAFTYGQPRTGDANYAKFVSDSVKDFYRVTHSNDGVPQVPSVQMGYQHHHKEFHQPGDRPESTVKCEISESAEPQGCINAPQFAALGVNDAHMQYLGVQMGSGPGTEKICQG